MQVKAEVQLVKDYGIIAQIKIEGASDFKTGFILNDHKLAQKYKPGQVISCRVLDIDATKKIVDLKEIDKVTEASKEFKAGHKSKGIIELNKEGYLVVSLKSNRSVLGVCLNNNFNQDAVKESFEIGEEIEVKANKKNGHFFELVIVKKEAEKKISGANSLD